MYALLLSIPIITATLAVAIFRWSFYGIKINQYGVKPKDHNYFPIIGTGSKEKDSAAHDDSLFHFGSSKPKEIIGWPEVSSKRRKVLIATMEYEIIDWKLKVKYAISIHLFRQPFERLYV